MDFNLIDVVREAMAQSELVGAVNSVRGDAGCHLALGDTALRPLSSEEIGHLEALGNTSGDWSRVQVAEGFDWSRVHRSSFDGDVVLGRFTDQVTIDDRIPCPTGIYQSGIANCVIGHNALVRDVRVLANYVVGPGAKLSNCATIASWPTTSFGNGQPLALGLEGGRRVPIYAEINVQVAAALASGPSRRALLQTYTHAIVDYVGQVASERGIIETGALVRDTPSLCNTYVGKYAHIEGATLVNDSTLLSSQQEPVHVLSGACVSHSVLQWGSSVATMAMVDRSVITEHAQVERQAKVMDSLLGPDTTVTEGDVDASLLGPLIGLRHHAFLTSVLWPEGKGNVSYGASVGSNYTLPAQDQEFRPGEGMFLGQGACIQLPADFSRSPYSIIANGVSTPPQKVTFPFALITPPSARWEGIAPACNEIFPGWVLTDNLYALKRHEHEFKARYQARRLRVELDVFRPEIIDLLLDSWKRLKAVTHLKDFYTSADIEGLGENVLLETHRKRALEAYQFFFEFYVLLGLKAQVHEALRGLPARVHGALGGWRSYAISRILDETGKDPRWEHQRRLFQEEMHFQDVADALGHLPEMLEKVAQSVELAKVRNDARGMCIIDDYADSHIPASQDTIIQQTWNETRRLQTEVASLLSRVQLHEAQGQ